MPDVPLRDLEHVLKNFNHISKDNENEWISTIESWSSGNIETPFTIKPEDFLDYAECDLKINDDHHLVNCLSNIKRAIECQIDSLLIGFGLFKKAKQKNWKFPTKLEKLNEIGIISPRFLSKINKLRNLLEHEYSIPDREKVEDALDVAILFIKYTDKFLYGIIQDFTFSGTESYLDNVQTALDYKNSQISFEFEWYHEDRKTVVNIDHNHPEYMAYLQWYVKMLDKKQRT
jgi:uncharacterized protein YutE (UPF0331/DUF86 family)